MDANAGAMESQYRDNAETCRRKAYQVRDCRLRAQFLELAHKWEQLSERLEKLGRDEEALFHPEC